MNRGLEIRNQKRKKNLQNQNTVKSHQKGVCRFIELKNLRSIKINRTYQYVIEHLFGLQVENKLFYVKDGKEHYVNINKKGTSVKTIYSENEIENFDPILLKRYNAFKNSLEAQDSVPQNP